MDQKYAGRVNIDLTARLFGGFAGIRRNFPIPLYHSDILRPILHIMLANGPIRGMVRSSCGSRIEGSVGSIDYQIRDAVRSLGGGGVGVWVKLIIFAVFALSACSADQASPSTLPIEIQEAASALEAKPDKVQIVRTGRISVTSETAFCSLNSNIIFDAAFANSLSELGVTTPIYLDDYNENTDDGRRCASSAALWSGGSFLVDSNAEGYEMVIAFWQGDESGIEACWIAKLVRDEDIRSEFAQSIPLGFDPRHPPNSDDGQSDRLDQYRRSLSIWDDQERILSSFIEEIGETQS